MNLTKILTGVLLILSLYLAWLLYRSVAGTIEDRASIATTEAAVIEKLKFIREAEIVFNSVNKRYTSNWDSWPTSSEPGKFPLFNAERKLNN